LKRLITSEEAIEILNKAGCSIQIIHHCKAVSNLAIKYAREIKIKGIKINVELVRIGGLLHDIGRSRTHGIDHAVIGADIVRSFDLPDSVVHIVERHIGSGIPAEETAKLGLPNRDFLPETLEEKVVSYADKLIEGNHEIGFDEALERFSREFGESNAIVKRFKRMHTELFQGLGSKS